MTSSLGQHLQEKDYQRSYHQLTSCIRQWLLRPTTVGYGGHSGRPPRYSFKPATLISQPPGVLATETSLGSPSTKVSCLSQGYTPSLVTPLPK